MKSTETELRAASMPEGKTRLGIPAVVLDALLNGADMPGDLTVPEGLLRRLTAALVERVLDAELTEHLGYPRHGPDETGAGNARNGHSKKRLRSDQGPLDIAVPRDRGGSFLPQRVKKNDRTCNGFDDKIIALYARGMSVADNRAHLRELYGTELSPELISRATDAVLDELRAWQGRPLEAINAVMYLDALVVKGRDGGTVQNKAAYLAIGVTLEGQREVLGMWFAANEGAKFWLTVIRSSITEASRTSSEGPQNRGPRPERRGGREAHVLGAPQHRGEVEASSHLLEQRHQLLRHATC